MGAWTSMKTGLSVDMVKTLTASLEQILLSTGKSDVTEKNMQPPEIRTLDIRATVPTLYRSIYPGIRSRAFRLRDSFHTLFCAHRRAPECPN